MTQKDIVKIKQNLDKRIVEIQKEKEERWDKINEIAEKTKKLDDVVSRLETEATRYIGVFAIIIAAILEAKKDTLEEEKKMARSEKTELSKEEKDKIHFASRLASANMQKLAEILEAADIKTAQEFKQKQNFIFALYDLHDNVKDKKEFLFKIAEITDKDSAHNLRSYALNKFNESISVFERIGAKKLANVGYEAEDFINTQQMVAEYIKVNKLAEIAELKEGATENATEKIHAIVQQVKSTLANKQEQAHEAIRLFAEQNSGGIKEGDIKVIRKIIQKEIGEKVDAKDILAVAIAQKQNANTHTIAQAKEFVVQQQQQMQTQKQKQAQAQR